MGRLKNIQRTVKVNCDLTADQWELYTATTDCTVAADTLNAAFNRLVNSGLDRRQVHNEMSKVMWDLADYGASDTEPRWVLDDLLCEVFNDRN